jgi:hypothetical protein
VTSALAEDATVDYPAMTGRSSDEAADTSFAGKSQYLAQEADD